ncbi:MAG TPA: hypothetical protein VGW36_03805, partial [Pyrinomonadaceae bacterium]|nr:hypothetical protein [Pyrinomonadaceae bacterium]
MNTTQSKSSGKIPAVVFAMMTVCLLSTTACGQTRVGTPRPQPQFPKPAHYEIKLSDLPPPVLEDEVNNGPQRIPQPANAKLNVPSGFEVSTFAEGGFARARWLALAPNGDVFLSDSQAGKIYVLRDANRDGVADERFVFAENQMQPFGLAFWKNYLYVGNTNAVVRFGYQP